MERTQIYLQKSQIHTLKRLAQKRDQTVSEVIRTLLRRGLNGPYESKHVKPKTFFDVLRDIKRFKETGPRKLAKNLDAYLYGGK